MSQCINNLSFCDGLVDLSLNSLASKGPCPTSFSIYWASVRKHFARDSGKKDQPFSLGIQFYHGLFLVLSVVQDQILWMQGLDIVHLSVPVPNPGPGTANTPGLLKV